MEQLILTVILTSVPLIFAASGELIAERSGVLNLGVEGMMLMGAVSAFAIAMGTGSPILGMFAGAFAGALTAGIFAFFTLGLATIRWQRGLPLQFLALGCPVSLARHW